MPSRVFQASFQGRRTVAIPAGPGFAAILVAAIVSGVGVLHFHQFEELFPIRTLFIQRPLAIADFDPTGLAVIEKPGSMHIPQILIPGDRARAKGPMLDRLQQFSLFAGLQACMYKISHCEFLSSRNNVYLGYANSYGCDAGSKADGISRK